MIKEELQDIIKSHEKWLNGGDGKRANLCGADLNRTDLCGTNLRCADMRGTNLHLTYLCGSDMSGADMSGSDMSGADMSGTNLRYADMSGSDMSGTDLSRANLSGARLNGADMRKVKYDEHTAFYALQCPEEGSFIGYKKAHGYIIKLEILADAKRSSATSRKCRCSAAKVLSITAVDGSEELKEIASDRDSNFFYRVGEIVRVDNFDEDRWNECSTGIHFFITRREAEQYSV